MASPYTLDQIDRYFEYISLPARYRRQAHPALNFDYLRALHSYQIAKIPYENLTLHYSREGRVLLEPQHLYNKLTRNGRGGYCMENNIFFGHVLRAVGFLVYSTGARVRPRVDGVPTGDYLGWVHMVNIVTLPDGTRYMTDVSFGGDGPTNPLPLLEGPITTNLGTQQLRLLHQPIPHLTSVPPQKCWIYQYRNDTTKEWNAHYCFGEQEFVAADYEVMNFFTSQSPGSFPTWTVLVVKFILEEDGEGKEKEVCGDRYKIKGKLMLVQDTIKRNDGGRTRVVCVCQTEVERVKALKDIFDITLLEEEEQGIRGRVAALPEN